MKAIIYARFSPRRNADNCESCQTQIEYCHKYCLLNNLDVISEYSDEAMSGATAANRTGLQSALEMACKNKAILVVYSLSRLARNTKETIEIAQRLEKSGADLASLHEKIDTTTAMGKFVFTLLAALAELERQQIAERTSEAMLRHQASGRRMSSQTPFGWICDPDNPARLIEDKQEQQAITAILQFHQQGYKLRRITRELTKAGFTPRQAIWHHKTIGGIIHKHLRG